MPGTQQPNIFSFLFCYKAILSNIPLSLCVCRLWLEDAMKENDPSSVLLFLVGTKKDLSVGEFHKETNVHAY